MSEFMKTHKPDEPSSTPVNLLFQGLGLDLKNAVKIAKKPLNLTDKGVVVQRLNLETLSFSKLKEYIESGAIAFLHEGKQLITTDKNLQGRNISCLVKETDEDEGTILNVTSDTINKENPAALDDALESLLESRRQPEQAINTKSKTHRKETNKKVDGSSQHTYSLNPARSRTPDKTISNFLHQAVSQFTIDKSRSERRKSKKRMERKKEREKALTRKLDERDYNKQVENLFRKRVENLQKIFGSTERKRKER